MGIDLAVRAAERILVEPRFHHTRILAVNGLFVLHFLSIKIASYRRFSMWKNGGLSALPRLFLRRE
jgi:hypothetical protein